MGSAFFRPPLFDFASRPALCKIFSGGLKQVGDSTCKMDELTPRSYPELYWFEDFPTGAIFRFGAWPLERQAMLEFARVYDPEPFHVDEAAAVRLGWDRLMASGLMVASIYRRLTKDAFPNARSVISPGWDGVSWLRPVYVDDILTCRAEVLSARKLASRPGEGVLKMRGELFVQTGVKVCEIAAGWFIRCRPGEDAVGE